MKRFATLLRREFQEHKGGLLWAPLVVGGLMLGFGGLVLGLGALGDLLWLFTVGSGMCINCQPLSVEPEAFQLDEAANLSLMLGPTLMPLGLTLALVLLFYAVGSLYDDRRDRSVLFWKSMPVSDAATVLSKLATMLLVAPAIAAAVGLAVGMLMALSAALALAAQGATAVLPALLAQPDFHLAPLAVFALLPVYALWALPSLAWFMAVSAWARRAPFLWATGLPLGVGILLSWQEEMFDLQLGGGWFWENVVARLFGGLLPGFWFRFAGNGGGSVGPEPETTGLPELVARSYATLGEPALWSGLVVGAALLALAIRLRRWREDAA
ncbi:MAG: hypothetical protein KGZ52_07930 [Xanthomonadaceae bacterium]|jgi:ABC-2 type transport system permease protein|nr:hypothetical protein [Xanthomonadaceae bacterium]